jgi:hypothetical protein
MSRIMVDGELQTTKLISGVETLLERGAFELHECANLKERSGV